MNDQSRAILNLTDHVRGATTAAAAALPPAAWGAGPNTQAAQATTIEEVRRQSEAAGDARDAPLSITDVTRSWPELGITET